MTDAELQGMKNTPRFKEIRMSQDFRLHKLDIWFFLFCIACFTAILLMARFSPDIRREIAIHMVASCAFANALCVWGIVHAMLMRRKLRKILSGIPGPQAETPAG